jgi:hypothetical protein
MLGVVIQMAVGPGQWVGIVMGRWVAGLGKTISTSVYKAVTNK